ncbi:hypothetical protein U9M48_017571 [Paspalum notatum var. saurae]|uniref:Uncharacterized protein n=1 Tax=Paspalum notatum var. saurae TaxID=547442 RepID=A0AAQ3TBP6_PASNO
MCPGAFCRLSPAVSRYIVHISPPSSSRPSPPAHRPSPPPRSLRRRPRSLLPRGESAPTDTAPSPAPGIRPVSAVCPTPPRRRVRLHRSLRRRPPSLFPCGESAPMDTSPCPAPAIRPASAVSPTPPPDTRTAIGNRALGEQNVRVVVQELLRFVCIPSISRIF